MGDLGDIFQIDWRIFMEGVKTWLAGGNPYGALSAEFGAGAFAYPPTALPWLALFVPFGPLGYYVWTALLLGGWYLLARREQNIGHVLLLIWAPMVLHLVQGQSTLAAVLLVWAAYQARQRGLLWGLALALALTKPQAVILPVLWLLWQERASSLRWRLIGGILLGTLLLALPATLRDPGIWRDWIVSLGSYRERLVQLAPWQGPSIVVLALAAYLWQRSGYGGWQWWLSAGLFPQTSFYGTVVLLPVLRPRQNYWVIGGLLLAGLVQGPMSPTILPWVLAVHLLAAWMVAGGPVRRPRPDDAPQSAERRAQSAERRAQSAERKQ